MPGRIVLILIIFLLFQNYSFGQRQIDSSAVVQIGGIKQYIRIKTKDDTKPILLFLHGGPGGSLMSINDRFTGELQKHFIVVQWDQRETGETLKRNKSPKPLTPEMFYTDTHEVIDTLLSHFRKPKLYLAGYSWGSRLGFYIADKYPEFLCAYLAISPVIEQRRSDSLSLEMLRATMGKEAQKELEQVKIPFENWEQLYVHRKWLLKQKGIKNAERVLPKSFVGTWAVTWFDVFTIATRGNLFESLKEVKCPVYFFAGAKDYNTSSQITKEYYEKIVAPKKDFFLFPNSGHEIPETDAKLLQELIIGRVLEGQSIK